MPSTYTPIASQTLSNSSSSSVTFSSIPQTYTDLILVANGTSTSLFTLQMRFNSDASNNYWTNYFNGTGSAAASGRQGAMNTILLGEFYPTNNTNIVQISNYTNSTNYKMVSAQANNSGYVQSLTGLWLATSNITRIDLTSGGPEFVSGSTFTLYGIKAA